MSEWNWPWPTGKDIEAEGVGGFPSLANRLSLSLCEEGRQSSDPSRQDHSPWFSTLCHAKGQGVWNPSPPCTQPQGAASFANAHNPASSAPFSDPIIFLLCLPTSSVPLLTKQNAAFSCSSILTTCFPTPKTSFLAILWYRIKRTQKNREKQKTKGKSLGQKTKLIYVTKTFQAWHGQAEKEIIKLWNTYLDSRQQSLIEVNK